MTIDEAIEQRIAEIHTAIENATDKRRALSALTMALAGMTGIKPTAISINRSQECCCIDADAKTCNHPETEEGYQCPGFSKTACALYEPDAPCATCGGSK